MEKSVAVAVAPLSSQVEPASNEYSKPVTPDA
jgi:hypothetical protein